MAEAVCSESGITGTYNQSLHIGSVFIILGVSFVGTLIPGLSKTRGFKFNEYAFTCIRSFGMGVILSTGFVHMFVTAVQTLTNPCLPPLFTITYSSWAGVIALLACLTTQLIQATAISHFSKENSVEEIKLNNHAHKHHHHNGKSHHHRDSECSNIDIPTRTDSLVLDSFPLSPSGSKYATAETSFTHQSWEVQSFALANASNADCCGENNRVLFNLDSDQHRQVTAYILELGIAMHSILIGIALGTTGGQEFISLLIAICFHQFFEGFALSATAFDAGFKSNVTPIVLSMVYTLSTPLGIVIGIGISKLFNANSVNFLIISGVFDSISAGILIYDALVNLITPTITNSHGFRKLSTLKKLGIYLALWLGAVAMSLLGLWA